MLDKLAQYVAVSPDSMSSLRLYEGDDEGEGEGACGFAT